MQAQKKNGKFYIGFSRTTNASWKIISRSELQGWLLEHAHPGSVGYGFSS